MKKYALIVGLIALLALPLAAAAQSDSGLPVPCQDEWPKVYLLVDNTRRHILDWNVGIDAVLVEQVNAVGP